MTGKIIDKAQQSGYNEKGGTKRMTEREKAVARAKARRMESYERNRIPEMVLLLLAISYILDAI